VTSHGTLTGSNIGWIKPYYCTSICVRSWSNWRATCVDSKPKEQEKWRVYACVSCSISILFLYLNSVIIKYSLYESWVVYKNLNKCDCWFQLIGPKKIHIMSLGPNLTRASTHIQIPLSLVCTSIFVPLPACDHSQGVYFPPNRRRRIVFRVLSQQINKKTNKTLVYHSTFVKTNALLAQLQSFWDQLAIFTFD